MEDDDVLPRSMESEKFGRLICASTAQNNWYMEHPDEFYFVTKNAVIMELSSQLKSYFNNGHAVPETADIRNETYMSVVQWLKSDEFAKNTGSKFIFRQPFIIGSSWTTLRRDDSVVDMAIGVRMADMTEITDVPQDAEEIFIRAFCSKFVSKIGEKAVMRNRTLHYTHDDFRVSIRLVTCTYPPFAARLTTAINQYDDFLMWSSSVLFFLQSWIRKLRERAVGTEQFALPNAHTMTCFWINFLQYYDLVPKFFNPHGTLDGSYLMNYSYEDIVRHEMPAYNASLFQAYQDFNKIRRDQPQTPGELLIMFFFHYGYLVDLVHNEMILTTCQIVKKKYLRCLGICLFDEENMVDTGVPDAHRFHFLMRTAHQLIKNAQNPYTTLDRLLNMHVDKTFNAMRDRMMWAETDYAKALEFYSKNTTDYEDNISNHCKSESSFEHFEGTECGIATFYRRISLPEEKKGDKSKQEPPSAKFTHNEHALKSFLTRPSDYKTGGSRAPMNEMMVRASKMFTTTLIPNPNDMSELNILFRPPTDAHHRLPVIEDSMMESYPPEFKVVEDRKSFVASAIATGHYEMKCLSDAKHHWERNVKEMTPKKNPGEKEVKEAILPSAIFTWGIPNNGFDSPWEGLGTVFNCQVPYAFVPPPNGNNPSTSAEQSKPNGKEEIDAIAEEMKKVMKGIDPQDVENRRGQVMEEHIEKFRKKANEFRNKYLKEMASRIVPNTTYHDLDYYT